MGEWVEQSLTAAQRDATMERLAVSRAAPLPGDRARWGSGPSHVDPSPGDEWIDVDTGRTWVFTDDSRA